jgi:hypothetical protein
MIRGETLPFLDPPFEILEFEPGKAYEFTVAAFKIGRLKIKPRWPGAPEEKEVIAIRIFVPKEEKPQFPHYWDITPSRLVTQLAAMLIAEFPRQRRIRVLRDIAGPKAHFSVQWVV